MRKLLIPILLVFIVGCKKHDVHYNGYIDADLTYLSSDFSGRISEIIVQRGNRVNAGQLLFKLEQTNESRNVAISKANQNNLLAQKNELRNRINYAMINYKRDVQLQEQGATSKDDVDKARQDLSVLQNQLSAIDAQLTGNVLDTAQKTWQLERKQNIAPESGIIFDSYFNPHEYVQNGMPIVSLITAHNIKIIFFVPETDLGKIYLGESITFTSDGNSSVHHAIISYISAQAEYTPPIIFSSEDRQKLVFRIEAHLSNPNLTQIHLGQPVSLELTP